MSLFVLYLPVWWYCGKNKVTIKSCFILQGRLRADSRREQKPDIPIDTEAYRRKFQKNVQKLRTKVFVIYPMFTNA